MHKDLVKEVPFGRGIARIKVTMWSTPKYSDGIALGYDEIHSDADVDVIVDGKVVSKGSFADVLEYNIITETYFQRAKMDPTKKYTRVGDKALTLGEETGVLINSLIKEMKAELSKEFSVQTEAEKQQREEIELAQEIVALAEKEGIDTLMSAAEIKTWRKRYNDLYNEGGEGYVPVKVSREAYHNALKVLAGKGAV